MEVLNSIPVKLDLEAVLKQMHVSNRSETILKKIEELIEIGRPIAKPKAIYDVSYVGNKSEDSLDIGGVRFTSRVLRVNLDKVERVFSYIVTCGRELDEIHVSSDKSFRIYCLDQIKEAILVSAMNYLENYLGKKYALGQISSMAPGSGAECDWPLAQQEGLFSIFGGRAKVEDLIGVKLTDKLYMIPLKSESGIFFQAEIKFEACQLCPRERCIGRQAPYDPDLVEKYKEAALRLTVYKSREVSSTS